TPPFAGCTGPCERLIRREHELHPTSNSTPPSREILAIPLQDPVLRPSDPSQRDVASLRQVVGESRRCGGAPCSARTCDLLVRSGPKGGNRGQRETAALRFSRKSHNSGQPPKAASRYRLSVICQSNTDGTSSGVAL